MNTFKTRVFGKVERKLSGSLHFVSVRPVFEVWPLLFLVRVMSTSSLDGSNLAREDTIEEDDEELMLREIFRFLDRDSGGTVSGQELSSLIRLVSSNYTEHQIKLLMNKADMNGDGEMCFEEFVRLLSSEPTDAQQETSATREAFEVFDAIV
ncbi:unnamed protein product [Echinostoma caproni]|uniref:EF-hand domain-containing protein n=1 Tax=Echinostoma caproni TaxID=27848 RepID=A0A183ANS7_9TREM|nr:unnamed protein product [Echinostoma caproni]